MALQPVLINGQWRESQSSGSFTTENPATRKKLDGEYPVSSWADCDAALTGATSAARQLRALPEARMAAFLDAYADRIEARAAEICELAHLETALPIEPRLAKAELPRTTDQLRQAAAAAREGSWCRATIDTKANIRSCLMPLGPVAVFGPNNFPLAFNGVSGGDFAAAIAAGNPVIAKANSSHPGTSRLLAEEAHAAAHEAELPPGTVQLLYRMSHSDGERLAADARLGAVAYTGSRGAGLALKAAADAAGNPIYLELSSVNPVVILPGALQSRAGEILDELVGSCLLGVGQFCTCPNLIVTIAGEDSDAFVGYLAARLSKAPVGTLLSAGVFTTLRQSVADLRAAGAELVTGGSDAEAEGYAYQNTLLKVSGKQFLANAEKLQTEAFGNATSVVVADDLSQAEAVLGKVEGSLTGSIFSAKDESDEAAYAELAPVLSQRVGRMLNDKMPTGVAVSPAMNHGGPFPATGHPGFTAVGIPASLARFAMLQCYDNVRPNRLPPPLADANPNGTMWRSIDGNWTQSDVGE